MNVEKIERICNHIITRLLGTLMFFGGGAGLYLELLDQGYGIGLMVLGFAAVAPTRLERAAKALGKVMTKIRG